MSKYFKLTVSSMSLHSLLIKHQMISIKMIFIVTSGNLMVDFSSDDGDWEHSETWEIDEKNLKMNFE